LAIGIVRVSRRAGRGGESFISPTDQRKRIKDACGRDGLRLKSVAEEIDVSGGMALEVRTGLREAIEAVEAGEVQVVVVGYFDRLFRSLSVQAEVVSRIEAAGGEVLALDFGRISEETASQWLSGTVMGAFAEYWRRQAAEKSRGAQIDAIDRGVITFPAVPLGLEKGPGKRLVPSAAAAVVVEAFRHRAAGESIEAVRTFLGERGHNLSYRRVQGLLGNRLLIGEIHFGDLVNLEAHEPVIPRDLFLRVQRVKIHRGPRPTSERLLARLGLLRCGTCGSRMVVGRVRKGTYPFYRCASFECGQRMTISAVIAERVVEDTMRAATASVEGRASLRADERRSERAAATSQAKLDAALRAFADFADEAAAQETLEQLRAERDRDLEALDRLGGKSASVSVSGLDWDRLLLVEKRDAIRLAIERIDVLPGRGAGRVHVHLFV
jgi:DNA invertase Pin-like site-specific DNA recombinase